VIQAMARVFMSNLESVSLAKQKPNLCAGCVVVAIARSIMRDQP
jgi:hypothetical protein